MPGDGQAITSTKSTFGEIVNKGDASMRKVLCAIALAAQALAFESTVHGQAPVPQPVLQRGYDPGLSGANLTETVLTPTSVTPTTFGLLFKLPVDDKIYAQPLYVPQVNLGALGVHNVVYVATMSDTLYAFDADVGGNPLWSVNFATSVSALPVEFANFTFGGNTNINGNLGILSTPVIDPSTHIMYLVACTVEAGTMVYRLHAVDITNGTEPVPNVMITGNYGGVTFIAPHQTQRASLTLSGNEVVFGFAAVEAETDDEGGYSGWVMAYNKQTLVQSGIFATTTAGATHGGGVWQSGRPPVVDGDGFVYVFTGNGYQSGYDGVSNFSESALRLDPADGLALVDWFTPSNWGTLDYDDLDLASSGPLLVPNTTPSLLAGGGKQGIFYLLNTTDLGQYSTTDKVVQEQRISTASLRGGPVYWQRSAANGGPLLFNWGERDPVKSWAFNGTLFGTTPSSQGTGSQIYPGGILALSANGQQQGSGVVWATVATSGNVYNDATDPGEMYAFNADNLSTTLWTSAMNSARDSFGTFAKFVPPTVANGKVYVATFSDQVAVYGLLPVPAATPTFSPVPGTYSGAVLVTIADATAGATIYYTTNGSTPTTASAVYSAPIVVSTSETLQAIASGGGATASAVGSAGYTILAPAATPTFSPAAGTYNGAQSVSIADATAGSTIYYTTNGSTPTTASAVYSAPIAVSASETLRAIAVAGGYATSAVGSAAYTIVNSTTVISDPTGFTSSAGLNLVGASLVGGTLELTNNTDYNAHAVWSGAPVNIQSFTTSFNFQITPATANSADGFTFTLQNAGPNVVGGQGGDLGYAGIGSSVAVKFDLYNNGGEGVDSTGFYTNGAEPMVPALDMSASGVNLHSANILRATITYDGTTLTLVLTDTVTNASYSASKAINIPATVGANTAYVGFTASTGGYSATQQILNWTYAVNGVAPATATPTFSPAAGAYTSAQSVTIADATAGATIYFTTDGSTPTTGSAVYAAPIAVSASETLRAIAAASGYTASAVGSAVYTIGNSTAVISDPNGFSSSAGFNFVGASLTGGTLELTNGTSDVAHAVWYATPVNIQSFTTSFNFQITPASASIADGFTFTIQNAGPNVVGGEGGDLGYAGIGSSVAVKFDLYSNAGEGVDSTGFFTNGADPTVPALDLTASGVNLHSGDLIQATIAYNGTTLTLILTDTVTHATYSASKAINIPATVGANTAYVGFTAGTGGESATQQIVNWTYNVNAVAPAVATPTFSPAAGAYSTAQSVTIADTTSGATIYYTTDGSTPTASSAVYGGAIAVNASETLRAIAVASGYTTSSVGSAAYIIGGAVPVISDPAGFTSSSGFDFVGASLVDGSLELTNGVDYEAHAVWYATPVNIQNFTTTFSFQVTPASANIADGFTFTLQNAGPNAVGGQGVGLGYAGIGSSVAVKFDLYNNSGEGADSTGFYTNGATPTVPALDMTGSNVNLHSGDVLQATIAYNGTTLTLILTDTVTNASYSASTAINIPATVGANTAYVGFTAGTGGYSATQQILGWTYLNLN